MSTKTKKRKRLLCEQAWYRKAPPKVNKDWSIAEKKQILKESVVDHMPHRDIAIKHGAVTAWGAPNPVKIHNIVRMGKREAQGLCHRCNEKLTAKEKVPKRKGQKTFLCDSCREKVRTYKTKIREEALKKGVCTVCGAPQYPGKTVCKKHLSPTSRRYMAKKGCSICGDKLSTRTLCKRHAAKMRIRNKVEKDER